MGFLCFYGIGFRSLIFLLLLFFFPYLLLSSLFLRKYFGDLYISEICAISLGRSSFFGLDFFFAIGVFSLVVEIGVLIVDVGYGLPPPFFLPCGDLVSALYLVFL